MSETYLITAKTVEEAIAIANREYADQDHEVSYEILEMPKKGFLGIGAKDAKIKITVTKSVSAELDSLVSDIRGMKVMTTRGGEGKKPQQKQNPQKKQNGNSAKSGDNAQKPQKQQNQPKSAEKTEPKQNQPKAENQQKQNAQKSEKTAQNNPSQQKQQRQDKPAQQKQNQPKQPKAEKQVEKQAEKQADKPLEKAPVKAEDPKAEEIRSEIASKLDAAIESATTVDVTPKFGDANAEYKSSLRNQAKPNRRAPQKASSGSGEKLGGGVTVSSTVSLNDFSAKEGTGFGYGESAGSGRISNDIRKGKKNQPKVREEAKPAETAETVEAPEVTAEAAAENRGEGKSRNRRRRDRKRGERRNEEAALQTVETAETADVPTAPAEPKKREPITQAEMDYALEFINTLLKNMALGATGVPAECPEGEEFNPTEEAPVYPKINIIGDDTGILIGHHGETLDAIQYLVNLSALRKSKSKDGDYIKIVVDIENYREKREETLRQLARRMAARAVKYRRNVFLEPMNAYERRIIHSELQSFENVSTHSVGADRDRKIIITYEGPDKAPEKPRRRRGEKKPADVEQTAEVAEITYNTEEYSAEEDNASEVMEAIGHAVLVTNEENTAGAGDGENRRPRKVQKMPIEKFTELLAASETEPDEKPAFED
ncbi:MAG: Jag N-terminal domain-containing protein [Clostridia bacterium]|nr:Jag N-terminal domain-containing protein [Clostridia bacterium]